MQAEQHGTSAQGSLLRLTTLVREQVKALLDASASLETRSKAWKPEARADLGRVREAGEKILGLVGPPVACPQCQQPLAYLPQHWGRKARCAPCGHLFRLNSEPPSLAAPAAAATAPAPATPKKKRRDPVLIAVATLVILLGLAATAATLFDPWSTPAGQSMLKGAGYKYDYNAPAKDDVESNRSVTEDLLDLSFSDAQGRPVKLADYRGKKNLVLVVMRGYSGQLCLNCLSQTSRLINNYGEFTKREAEVVLAFPGQREHLAMFLERSAKENDARDCPFPVLLDEGAKMVDRLGIRADLASPSTYILDRDGKVRFAYVGATITDRPSVKAMLTHLDRLSIPPGTTK